MECPVVPYTICGAADFSPDSCYGWVINTNVHSFLNGPGDPL